jgi:glycosyltransferase involved in cell wall biosynthesis
MTAAGGPRDEWAFVGRRVVVVSRFPPARDGIARYAGQLNDVLSTGRELLRLGVPFGGGDRTRALWGGLRPLRIVVHARGFDEVLVHYHPHYFVRGAFLNRLMSYVALAVVARLRRTTWIVHEPDDVLPVEVGRRGLAQFAIEERVRRALWAGADTLVFHSEWEQRRFDQRFPPGRKDRRELVVTHGSFFTAEATLARPEARRRLNLPADGVVLLCIGFISPHKEYERVIDALDVAAREEVELHIVGTPIRPMPDVERHVEELRRLAAERPRVHLHEQFVSDEDFDCWVRAADAVLTPYRESSSSGVMARAQLLGTTVITSAAGGMAEQAGPADLSFATQEELVEAIRTVAGGGVA